jgi:hypothetical protein
MSPDARRTAGANGVAPPRTSSSAQRPTSAGGAPYSLLLGFMTAQLTLVHRALATLGKASRAHSPMSFESCLLQAWRRQAPAR